VAAGPDEIEALVAGAVALVGHALRVEQDRLAGLAELLRVQGR